MRLLHSIQPGPQAAKGQALFAPPVQQQMQQQQQQQQQAGGARGSICARTNECRTAPADRRSSKSGRGRRSPRDMQTYIETKVIEPAFTRANQAWALSGLAIAQHGTATISRDIAKAKTAAPGAATQFEYLAASVNALGNEARRLRFAPPAGFRLGGERFQKRKRPSFR